MGHLAIPLHRIARTVGPTNPDRTPPPLSRACRTHGYRPSCNWPYTFGLLFGIGLFARFREDPDRFRSGYDDLLSSTGMDDAAGLASRFGIDLRDGAFWAAGLDVLAGRVDELERLTAGHGRA